MNPYPKESSISAEVPANGESPALSQDLGGTADTKLLIQIVEILRQSPSNDRVRLVEAALLFLGTPLDRSNNSQSSVDGGRSASTPRTQEVDSQLHEDAAPVPRRALAWLSQNDLKVEELDGVFHRAGSGAELIAHNVPGRSNKERVRACYLLAGVKSLLYTSEPKFSDDDARRLCRDLGCYDKANHATYVKALGNLIIGSKSAGYELTQPGLRAAAEILRSMRAGASN